MTEFVLALVALRRVLNDDAARRWISSIGDPTPDAVLDAGRRMRAALDGVA